MFLTADYTLNSLAAISRGDRILIHAAAGGVGMAALQLARRAGAELFTTAGSAEKRKFLYSLGVQHVMDSRSSGFSQEIMKITGGRGVDIVLNSLTGNFIPEGLSVLAPNGRFIEIGRRDIWDEDRVAKFKSGITYHAMNLLEYCLKEPESAGAQLGRLVEAFEEGKLQTLPLKVFALEEAAQAFRYMAQARHIGKIVVSHPGPAGRRTSPQRLRPDGAAAVFKRCVLFDYRRSGRIGAGTGKMADRARSEASCADGPKRSIRRSGAGKSAHLQKAGARVDVVQADVAG